MLRWVWGFFHGGKTAMAEPIELPKGTRAPPFSLPEEDSLFWTAASQSALARVWDNAEGEVYAELLAK